MNRNLRDRVFLLAVIALFPVAAAIVALQFLPAKNKQPEAATSTPPSSLGDTSTAWHRLSADVTVR